MLLSAHDVKEYDFSDFENFSKFYAKGGKLKWSEKPDKKGNLTVGFVERFDCIGNDFEIKDFNTGEILKTYQLDRKCYNIYNEKYFLIKNLDIIQPDLQLFFKIYNHHYSKMKEYRLIDQYDEMKTKDDLYKELANHYKGVHSHFKSDKRHNRSPYSMKHITNTSSITLFPRYDKRIMVGMTLRLALKNNVMIRISAMPQLDGSYQYYFKDVSIRAKGSYFLINQIEDFYEHLEDLIFKNAYYYATFKKEFGILEKNDLTDEHFRIYEMIKY